MRFINIIFAIIFILLIVGYTNESENLYDGNWILVEEKSNAKGLEDDATVTIAVLGNALERFVNGKSIKNSDSAEDCSISDPKLTETVTSCIGESDRALKYIDSNNILIENPREALRFKRLNFN